MKAIIIAAGRGSRMKHMTETLPKCMAIVLDGKTLLQIQIETLRTCGISEIVLIKGYQGDKINYSGMRYYENTNYANNNILESLFCAKKELEGEILVTYSDIWYEANIVHQLWHSDHDIVVGVNTNWGDQGHGQKDNRIEDREHVLFDPDHKALKIGKIYGETKEVHGEFIGMTTLTSRGCQLVKNHYERAKKLHTGKPYQRARVFEQAYLTDLLQDMADEGTTIHCELINNNWIEIDTVEDFARAVARLEEKRI